MIGYFTESLPDEHLNSLDFAVIDWFSASLIGKALSYVRSNFFPLIKKCFFFKPPAHPKKPLTKARREVAFEKFILALSDQQLVTGIAILVAVFANHCRTSIYELNIAISLAWFSCTTHLATLNVLHRYFRKNVVVRHWRMVGMIGVLVLLIPGLVLIDIYELKAPQIPMQCYNFLSSDSDDGIGPLASVFVISYLIVAYTSRLYKTFTSDDGSMADPEWLIWNVLLRLFSRTSKSERHTVIEKAIRVCDTRRMIHIEEKLEALSTKHRFMKRLGLCIGAYSRSFLQLIAALLFFLSYGISGVVADRWLNFSVDLEEGSSTMEFGQIVPLVLLIIPMLAYAEVFYGEFALLETFGLILTNMPQKNQTRHPQTSGLIPSMPTTKKAALQKKHTHRYHLSPPHSQQNLTKTPPKIPTLPPTPHTPVSHSPTSNPGSPARSWTALVTSSY